MSADRCVKHECSVCVCVCVYVYIQHNPIQQIANNIVTTVKLSVFVSCVLVAATPVCFKLNS